MRKTILSVILLCLICGGCAVHENRVAESSAITLEEKIKSITEMWYYAKSYYGNWQLVSEEVWDAAYYDALEKVRVIQSDKEYRSLMRQFGALLQDGHFGIKWENEPSEKYLPLRFSVVESKLVVKAVDSSLTDIPVLSFVDQIEGQDWETYAEMTIGKELGIQTPGTRQAILAQLLQSSNDEEKTITLDLTTPQGESIRKTLTYSLDPDQFQWTKYISLNVDPAKGKLLQYYSTPMIEAKIYRNHIGYIKIKSLETMEIAEEFEEVMSEYTKDLDYYILDLRENGGGSGGVAQAILHHFYPNEIPSLIMYQKESSSYAVGTYTSLKAMNLSAGDTSSSPSLAKRIEQGELMLDNQCYIRSGTEVDRGMLVPLSGVVVLTGNHTGSAAEDMAAYAQAIGIPLIGEHTRGATGQLAILKLTDGAIMTFSTVRVVSPLGEEFFNHGIQPDYLVEQTMEDFFDGYDTVLNYALNYAEEQLES